MDDQKDKSNDIDVWAADSSEPELWGDESDEGETALGQSAKSEPQQQPMRQIQPNPPSAAREEHRPEIRPVAFQSFSSPLKQAFGNNNMDLLMDVNLPLSVQLGTTRMTVKDILGLGPGSVIELDKAAGGPVDLLVNDKLIARGEVVVIDENFGIRIVEIINGTEEEETK